MLGDMGLAQLIDSLIVVEVELIEKRCEQWISWQLMRDARNENAN